MKDLSKIPEKFHILFSDKKVDYNIEEIAQLINEYNNWSIQETLKLIDNGLSKTKRSIQD
jgi:hypothetical protein